PGAGPGGRPGRGGYPRPVPAFRAPAEMKASQVVRGARAGQYTVSRGCQTQILLFLLAHPWLADAFAERLTEASLPDPALEALKQRIVELVACTPALDSLSIKDHLLAQGAGAVLDRIASSIEAKRSMAARPGAGEAEIVKIFSDSLRRPEATQQAGGPAGDQGAGKAREPGTSAPGSSPSAPGTEGGAAPAGSSRDEMARKLARVDRAHKLRRPRDREALGAPWPADRILT
ncbi:MAG: hypothetical protein HXY25_12485, partial [Alphaproteobacteria bacterium]|nr:hypothetical protein [Alphaproteobacteria bacterium]